jgi:hypothetical protein
LLLGLALSTLWTSRMIVWFAPVAAYYFTLHASAVWNHRRHHFADDAAASGRSAWTYASILVICAILSACAFGRHLQGKGTINAANLSPYTPIAATAYLNGNAPEGQIFNLYEWGDYLIWAGPQPSSVFVASHAHLIPQKVWQDYFHVLNLGDDWEAVLDRYGVQAVVVDTYQHHALVRAVKQSRIWRVAYEDAIAVIFIRAANVDGSRASNDSSDG